MTERFDLTETPENIPGFRVSVTIEHPQGGSGLVVKAGGIVYGFGGGGEDTVPYGYLVTEDIPLAMTEVGSAMYVMLHRDGTFRVIPGDFACLRKPGAVDGLPWYTLADNDDEALVGKCFFKAGFFQGAVICNSPRWCEFEGVY